MLYAGGDNLFRNWLEFVPSKLAYYHLVDYMVNRSPLLNGLVGGGNSLRKHEKRMRVSEQD